MFAWILFGIFIYLAMQGLLGWTFRPSKWVRPPVVPPSRVETEKLLELLNAENAALHRQVEQLRAEQQRWLRRLEKV